MEIKRIHPDMSLPEFELTLTRQEAVDLMTTAGLFSGTPRGTIRETLDNLYMQLEGVNVHPDKNRLKSSQLPTYPYHPIIAPLHADLPEIK